MTNIVTFFRISGGTTWIFDQYLAALKREPYRLYDAKATYISRNHLNYYRFSVENLGDITLGAKRANLILIFDLFADLRDEHNLIRFWKSWNFADVPEDKSFPPVVVINKMFALEHSPEQFLRVVREALLPTYDSNEQELEVTTFTLPDAPSLKASLRLIVDHVREQNRVKLSELFDWCIKENLVFKAIFSRDYDDHGHVSSSGPGLWDYLKNLDKQGYLVIEPNKFEIFPGIKQPDW